ncbi:SMP-30/gluconolactonase/LRE family protein [Neptunicella marina]|uniref:SMP-30/gluconolactonase/LRE family protein n=1 Tax=Neptunicella marina TaxID=2125989 RepID=A0A8J6M0J8_9ALTE|nr:SMP-30/gluconolactonase/LRE family protein [Neptunicella marina]MBC3767214.1 SMP-30/gluconolactonase/LRE family protein [Neptunicella marina]
MRASHTALTAITITTLVGCSQPQSASSTSSKSADVSAQVFKQPAYCSASDTSQTIGAETKVSKIADGFVFVEGAVWSDKSHSFYFSEMNFDGPQQNGPEAKIHQLVLPDQMSVFIEHSGSNGLAIDNHSLLAATHDNQSLSRYDLNDKTRTIILTDINGKHFNSPNDLTVSSQGDIYFTDPNWQLGERENQTGVTGVYWRKPDGSVELIDGTRENPNGISLSPDEKTLYVGDKNGEILQYQRHADGSIGDKSAFTFVQEPDGMAVDCAGNLYITSHTPGILHVVNPQGHELAQINVATKLTNAAFGGEDHKTLLLTAGGAIYRLQSPIPGYPY